MSIVHYQLSITFLMRTIDLRSDTVTKPTPAMRQAMANAEVGDDVLGDDPTVRRLEEQTAAILGKEAALFVPSGTMSNQIALKTHTQPGDEILVDANAHVYYYEAGAPAALSGVMCRLLPAKNGIFSADDVRSAIRPADIHFPTTRLLWMENTHNRGGGTIWPIDKLSQAAKATRELGLALHLDGARLWNATAATRISEKEYASYFDSVSVCFSKGLGAPVGSALAGSHDFIRRARRIRKQFGGGMRQAGIIAAGALYALENHRSRLVQDHENIKALAKGLSKIPGLVVDSNMPDTNMLWFKVTRMPAPQFCTLLKESGILMLALGSDTMRAVTHLDVNSEDIQHVIEIIQNRLG